MKSFPTPLTSAEEQYYMQKYTEGDLEAKHILIEHNLRLVAHIVKKYQRPEEDNEDLISIGTVGLIKAVITFNPEKGNRLSTYAARCIENEILMMLRSRKKSSREISLYERSVLTGKVMKSSCLMSWRQQMKISTRKSISKTMYALYTKK